MLYPLTPFSHSHSQIRVPHLLRPHHSSISIAHHWGEKTPCHIVYGVQACYGSTAGKGLWWRVFGLNLTSGVCILLGRLLAIPLGDFSMPQAPPGCSYRMGAHTRQCRTEMWAICWAIRHSSVRSVAVCGGWIEPSGA